MLRRSGKLTPAQTSNYLYSLGLSDFKVTRVFSIKFTNYFHAISSNSQVMWNAFWGLIYAKFLPIENEAFSVAVSNKSLERYSLTSSPVNNLWTPNSPSSNNPAPALSLEIVAIRAELKQINESMSSRDSRTDTLEVICAKLTENVKPTKHKLKKQSKCPMTSGRIR